MTEPSDSTVDPGSGLWTPGVWVMRRLPAPLRAALLLALSLLPALPWLAPAAHLPALSGLWVPLLVVALYAWVCAGVVKRPSAVQARHEPALAAAASTLPPVPIEAPVEPAAQGAAVDATIEPEPAPVLPPETASPAPETQPAAAPAAQEAADVRVGHAEIRGAADEIARRVVSASGLLDACAKTADQAHADIEALRDEGRHAQKLLASLRGRLLLLDQRCHALAQAAAPDELHPRLQAALAQVLHCHQLAERLGAVERDHGVRMESLRQGVDRIDSHAERGLREAHQVMALTRRVQSALDATEPGLDAPAC